MSNQWLESVARGTVHVFTEHILKIRELTDQSTKQLVMDIGMSAQCSLTNSSIALYTLFQFVCGSFCSHK